MQNAAGASGTFIYLIIFARSSFKALKTNPKLNATPLKVYHMSQQSQAKCWIVFFFSGVPFVLFTSKPFTCKFLQSREKKLQHGNKNKQTNKTTLASLQA